MYRVFKKNVPVILTINYDKTKQVNGLNFGMDIDIIYLHYHAKNPIPDPYRFFVVNQNIHF